MPMSQKQYVKAHGMQCPFCYGQELYETSVLEQQDVRVYIDIRCHGCKKEWTDVYILHSYVASENRPPVKLYADEDEDEILVEEEEKPCLQTETSQTTLEIPMTPSSET